MSVAVEASSERRSRLGGFAPLHPKVLTQWTLPVRNVDAVHHPDDGGDPWWLSTEWLREAHGDGRDGTVLSLLLEREADSGGGDSSTGPLTPEEATREGVDALFGFLLARRPEGLTTASLGDRAWWVGCTRPDGAALLRRRSPCWVVVGDAIADDAFRSWVREWREAGCPDWDDLRPEVSLVEDGWRVRVSLASRWEPATKG